jgi:hypothetical protein
VVAARRRPGPRRAGLHGRRRRLRPVVDRRRRRLGRGHQQGQDHGRLRGPGADRSQPRAPAAHEDPVRVLEAAAPRSPRGRQPDDRVPRAQRAPARDLDRDRVPVGRRGVGLRRGLDRGAPDPGVAAGALPRWPGRLRRADRDLVGGDPVLLLAGAGELAVGADRRRRVGPGPGHQAQRVPRAAGDRAALRLGGRGRRRDPGARGAGAGRRGPRARAVGPAVSAAGADRPRAADPVRAVAVAVARSDRSRPRLARVPPAPRPLQLRVPRRELEPPAVSLARRAGHDRPDGAGRDPGRGGPRPGRPRARLVVDPGGGAGRRSGAPARAVGGGVDGAVLPRLDADLRRREALGGGDPVAVRGGRDRRGVGGAARGGGARRALVDGPGRRPRGGGDRGGRRRGGGERWRRDPPRPTLRAHLVQRRGRRCAGRRRPRHEPAVLGLRRARRARVPGQPAAGAGLQPRRQPGLGRVPARSPVAARARRRRARGRRGSRPRATPW